jgi:hypothetical protein
MKLIKQIVKKSVKGDNKSYTNYYLEITVVGKTYRVAIQPKTFGRDWKHPSVRQSFALLDIMAELEVKE